MGRSLTGDSCGWTLPRPVEEMEGAEGRRGEAEEDEEAPQEEGGEVSKARDSGQVVLRAC